MNIKRKLTDREQKLLQILINERNKSLQEIAHLTNTDFHDLQATSEATVDESDLSFLNVNPVPIRSDTFLNKPNKRGISLNMIR